MLTTFLDLINSKKFWMTIGGSVVVGVLTYSGAPSELILTVGSLFGLNITAQGMADFKKNQPR